MTSLPPILSVSFQHLPVYVVLITTRRVKFPVFTLIVDLYLQNQAEILLMSSLVLLRDVGEITRGFHSLNMTNP